MKRYVAAHIAILAVVLSLQASGQVINMESGLTRTVKASRDGGQTDVNLSVIPASVTLAGGRREQGWFMVVTDPRQKLYWWRFQTGTFVAGNSLPVDEFIRGCMVYAATQKLVVFCSTSRHVLIGISSEVYPSDAALPGLVRSAFDRRAPGLDTGFAYFDKTLNLWSTLGSDFFFEPGRADSIDQIGLRSVTRSDDKWELIVAGAGQASAKLTFSPDFSLQDSVRLR